MIVSDASELMRSCSRLISAIRDDGASSTALGREYGRGIDEGLDEFDEPLSMAPAKRKRRRVSKISFSNSESKLTI